MQFEDSFFKEEERCGFVVSAKMKHAWAAQLEVLEDLDVICKAHNITYYAAFGTLLGAIRHKGFIPWDDDIDIMMKRKDYERFYEIATHGLPSPYIAYNLHTKEMQRNVYYMRFTNGRQVRFDAPFLKKYHGFPYVIGIDIFPLDVLPNDPDQKETMYQILSLMEKTRRLLIEQPNLVTDLKEELDQFEQICGAELKRDDSLEYTLLEQEERIATMYNDIEDIRYYSFPITGWPPLSKEALDGTILMPFENTQIPVPVGYHEAAVQQFGPDYMTPRQEITHDYPFFRVQEEEVIKAGMKLPEY